MYAVRKQALPEIEVPELINELNSEELIDYIVEHHHTYTRDAIPRLEQILENIVYKLGHYYPELRKIQRLFSKLGKEFTIHIEREERAVFPYIRRISEAVANNLEYKPPAFGTFKTVKILIEAMVKEHTEADFLLNEIRMLGKNFTPSYPVCIGIIRLYKELKEFESDLNMHIYLENNILFPKAIALEESLKSQPTNIINCSAYRICKN